MSYWLLPLSYTFLLTIDRLEGSYAIIEWPNEALTTIPYKEIPFSIQEGCQLELNLYPSPLGGFSVRYEAPFILNRFGTLLVIPIENTLKKGLSYWFSFQKNTCGEK